MIYYIFEIATAFFECLLVHIFFYGWFGTKSRNFLKSLFFMALYFILHCSVSLISFHPAIRMAISYFLVLGISAVLYETTLVTAIYSSLLYMALAVVSEYLSLLFMNILGFDTGVLMTEGNARAIYLALAKTLHFSVVIIVALVFKKNRTALTIKQVALLLPCIIISIYICTVFFDVFPNNEKGLSLSLLIALAGLLYINGIIVVNTQSIKTAIVENEEQKLAARHYEMQEQYYQNIIKDREETRALWHDVNKYLTAIKAIVASGNTSAAKKEYEAMRQTFDNLGTVVDVENEPLNSIIYHNIKRAETYNIPVHLTAQVSPEISISPVDLSVILGNTFDNAIEECTLLSDDCRKIIVSLIQQNNMLFYEIKNTCVEIPHKKSGSYHGYGLKNVKVRVQKYGGTMESGKINGYFCVSIRLNIQSN